MIANDMYIYTGYSKRGPVNKQERYTMLKSMGVLSINSNTFSAFVSLWSNTRMIIKSRMTAHPISYIADIQKTALWLRSKNALMLCYV